MELIQIKNYSLNQIQNLINDPNNPVTFTYVSKSTKKAATIPIWTYYYEKKFYCFAGGNSKKVQAIKAGNKDIVLLIINREYYPHPESEFIPYLGVMGEARICTHLDNPKTAWIHQQLLLKYDPELSQGWIRELFNKIDSKPEKDWLIEIIPQMYYSSS
ncbi:MAG: hypothetical protein ACFFB3_07070 [Candidatus Hodarchaeota archaeon]